MITYSRHATHPRLLDLLVVDVKRRLVGTPINEIPDLQIIEELGEHS
jgi:hypothetical protein